MLRIAGLVFSRRWCVMVVDVAIAFVALLLLFAADVAAVAAVAADVVDNRTQICISHPV